MKIELIRHGKTALQEEGKYQGKTDAPLSEKGRSELRCALARPDLLVVSSRIRTHQTAAILFPGIDRVEVPELDEMDFGDFEGRNFREMEQNRAYRRWVDGMCEGQCPGGEAKAEFSKRVTDAFLKEMRRAEEKEVPTVALVVHGGTIMAIMDRFCRQKRDYFAWNPRSGTGYLVEGNFRNPEPVLELIGTIDYTRG